MITPEMYSELQAENEKLKRDLIESEKSVIEFESLAKEWRDNCLKTKNEMSVKLTHAEQIIESLREEIRDWYKDEGPEGY